MSCEILLQAGNRCHVISHLDHVDLFFYLKKPATQAMKTHVTRGKKKKKIKKEQKIYFQNPTNLGISVPIQMPGGKNFCIKLLKLLLKSR